METIACQQQYDPNIPPSGTRQSAGGTIRLCGYRFRHAKRFEARGIARRTHADLL